jgi:DNA-binding LacI/PurR family transcriptional regulator
VLHGKRPTSRDVAAAAGVSRATVSYVLNGADTKHRITPATRDRVLEVAERLGYEPNAVALALRAGRTEIVLVEIPNWPLGPPVAEAISTRRSSNSATRRWSTSSAPIRGVSSGPASASIRSA